MKVLASLIGLQCAGIGFLVYQSLDGGRSAGASAPAVEAPAHEAADAGWIQASPNEERLRQIIREELAAQRVAADAASAGRTVTAATTPRNPEQDRQQKERVGEQIAHFRSVGRISQEQMLELQGDIARLDPVSRREALAQLMRAMNSGEIEGRM